MNYALSNSCQGDLTHRFVWKYITKEFPNSTLHSLIQSLTPSLCLSQVRAMCEHVLSAGNNVAMVVRFSFFTSCSWSAALTSAIVLNERLVLCGVVSV